MEVKDIVAKWTIRISAILFSLVLILLFVISATPLNSISIVVLWLLSFLFWVLYSGHELMVMSRILFLFLYKKVSKTSFMDSYDETSLLDALVFLRNRMLNIWDGHVIPFMIYIVFSSMLFSFVFPTIYVILGIAFALYIGHIIFRKICIDIIQYSS